MSAVTVLVIPPSGEPVDVEIDASLESLQHLVDGDIEQVTIFGDGGALIFNADHRAKANLAPNPTATRLLHMAGGDPRDYIAGTVIVVGPSDGPITPPTPMERAFVNEMRGDT
ncbi:MAG TPA: DUF3846 domain-containing protein [Acidimicrobiales bacterium]|nr:DUF3846 domain-containing protein [Acidimicrobiales bacterium]